MNGKIKQLWMCRPKMSRGWKTVRNCLVFLMFIFGFWISQGCPPATNRSALRELERRYFLLPGEIIYSARNQSLGGRAYFVLGEDCAYTVNTRRNFLHEVSASIIDETTADQTVKPLRLPAGREREEGLLWDAELFVPYWSKSTVTAELILSADYTSTTYSRKAEDEGIRGLEGFLGSEQERWVHTSQNTDCGEGYFRFSFKAMDNVQASLLSEIWTGAGYYFASDTGTVVSLDSIHYRLNFYGADHHLLESFEGEIDDWGRLIY